MKNFIFPVLLLICCACSTTEFSSTGREIFKVSATKGSEKEITAEATKDFYFWGISPELAEFDFQDEFQGLGVYNPSYVSIEQSFTLKDIFFTFVTLGLYSPVTYQVTVLSNGEVK